MKRHVAQVRKNCPEKNLDCRADIYSLGMVMYKMLTGKFAFEGKSDVETMELQINKTHESVQLSNKKVSDDLSSVIDKMLAKNREERHPDWKILGTDLDAILDWQSPPSLSMKPDTVITKDTGWLTKIFRWK